MTEETASTAAAPQSLAPADGMRWYVVHAYSGMEKAVERNIIERVNNAGCRPNLAAPWCQPKRLLS